MSFTTISVSSGKGGVGKTVTTVNIALAAASLGRKVLLLDGDYGLANVDVVLGLSARYNINDVIDNVVPLSEAIMHGPSNIDIIPSGSGLTRLTRLSALQRLNLLDQIDALASNYDTLLIDTGAGISETVMHFNKIADAVVVVTTPEPHAMTDAYATIKVAREEYGQNNIYLLVNMVDSERHGQEIFQRLNRVAKCFLRDELQYLGCVPRDQQVSKLIGARSLGSKLITHTIAGQAYARIGRDLIATMERSKRKSHREVWKQVLWSDAQEVQIA